MSFTFPQEFYIPNLALRLSEKEFSWRRNPCCDIAREAVYPWYTKFDIQGSIERRKMFLKACRLDQLAALTFSKASPPHLKTCLMFYLWAFLVDDLADEGSAQGSLSQFEHLAGLMAQVLAEKDLSTEAAPEESCYVTMLRDIVNGIRTTGSEAMQRRFTRGFTEWNSAQIFQLRLQAQAQTAGSLPTVEEYMEVRRKDFGNGMASALLEYTLDLDLPDAVIDHPTVTAVMETLFDIAIFTNDLCSFNKEQAQGDYRNLVCVIMAQHQLALQPAITKLVAMVDELLIRYRELRAAVPSFGDARVDKELAMFLDECEVSNLGMMTWYYESPRYFGAVKASDKEVVLVTLF